ncbi:DUF3303 family protein [Haloferax sp. DFSO52]|uniref:DUF3303 family protein n=1 Tax=Haloferax sp. DFSO52 TaxID=3388505 RepID=UPI003A84CF4B
MLFVSYWEINENKPPAEILEAGAKLMESELWPPEGVEIIRWDLTSDNWGVTVFEADTAEAAERVVTVWRLAVPGMFTKTKTAPAGPADQAMLDLLDMMDAVPVEA